MRQTNAQLEEVSTTIDDLTKTTNSKLLEIRMENTKSIDNINDNLGKNKNFGLFSGDIKTFFKNLICNTSEFFTNPRNSKI